MMRRRVDHTTAAQAKRTQTHPNGDIGMVEKSPTLSGRAPLAFALRAAPAVLLSLLFAIASPVGTRAVGAAIDGPASPVSSAAGDVAPQEADGTLGVDGLMFDLPNGSFDTGDFTAWMVNSPLSPFLPNPAAANAEVVSAFDIVDAGMNPAAAPTDGAFMALLCNGPGNVTNVEQNNLDGDSNPENDNDRVVVAQSFTLTPSDVPATFSFDWNWMTSEAPVANDPFDDFFQVTLNGDVVLAGSRDGGGPSPFADVPTDGVPLMVMSDGDANGCQFTRGQSGWNRFVTILTTPQTYNLAFVVADQGTGDFAIDSGLLIDNVRIEPEVDLVISKTADPEPAFAGESLVYTIRVENRGTGVAMDVVVTDTLEADMIYIADTGACDNSNANTGFTPSLTCDLGDMRGGEVREIRVKVDLPPDMLANRLEAGADLILVNEAGVDSLSPDVDPTNNYVELRTLLMDRADLKITKLGLPLDTVRAGEIFSYTLYVDNLGPSDSRNVTIVDNITSLGSFTGLQVFDDPNRLFDSCTIFDMDITCTLGEPLEPQSEGPLNGRWTIQIQGMAVDEQDINNVARVFSADPPGPEGETMDPDTSNNMAMDSLTVVGLADLEIKKIGFALDDGSITVRAGRSVSYTLNVINHGPSTAEGVVVYDNLPPSFVEGSFIGRAMLPGGDSSLCTVGTAGDPLDPMVCNIGNLLPGQSAEILILADIDPSFVIDQPNTEFGNILANEAYVISDTFDPDISNNRTYEINIEVIGEADLEITKEDAPDPVRAGRILDYRIRVENHGPSSAENVIIDDDLPANVTFLAAYVLGARGSCYHNAGQNLVRCDLDNMVPGEIEEILIVVRVNEDTPDGTILSNTAHRNADLTVTPDPVPGNDSSTATTLVIADADLGVVKTVDDLTPIAGTELTYTVTVTNYGPALARNVVLTDTLPAGVTWLVDTINCGPPGPGNVMVCDLGDMPSGGDRPDVNLIPGSVKTFSIRVRVDPETVCGNDVANNLRNTVTVSSDNPDPVLLNNTDTEDVNVMCQSDLRVVKFGKRDEVVRAGDILTYTVLVDNNGPSWAKNVALKDILQSSARFDLIDVHSDRDASCSLIAVDDAGTPHNITSALPASPWPPTEAPPAFGVLPPFGVQRISERLELDCTRTEPQQILAADGPPNTGRWLLTMRVRAMEEQDINNTAWVLSDSEDIIRENNEAFVKHEITDVADLQIEKTQVGEVVDDVTCPTPNPFVAQPFVPDRVTLRRNRVTAGLDMTYTITVTNLGPSPAENVVLVDRLPPGIVVTGYSATQGDCQTGTPGAALDRMTCGLDTLLNGATATVTVNAHVESWVPHGAILENDVFVYSDVFDDHNGNNYSSNLTTVDAAADLIVTKTDNPDPVTAGELLQYTVTVTNTGPSDARNVVVSDTLPSDAFGNLLVTYITSIGAACVQDAITGELTCPLGDMAAGQVIQFKILTRVVPDAVVSGAAADAFVNVVEVRSDTRDPCLLNNIDDEVTEVLRAEDVYITKSDNPDPVLAGNEVTYTIVFGNEGVSTATTVSVTDDMPAGLIPLRCDPIAIDEAVTCSGLGVEGGVVTLNQILLDGSPIWTDLPTAISLGDLTLNDLDPGESYSFKIVAEVESGYVLDDRGDTAPGEACHPEFLASGYPHFAHNRAVIASLLDTGEEGNNASNECTRVNSLADLSIDLTDVIPEGPAAATLDSGGWHPPLAPPAAVVSDRDPADQGSASGARVDHSGPDSATRATGIDVAAASDGAVGLSASLTASLAPDQDITGFLTCDPVQPGATISYRATVTNDGPSDAAAVLVEIQLPLDGVVLDPTMVEIVVSAGEVLEVRDDGRIIVALGRDPNLLGVPELGRINVGGIETIDIQAMVAFSAPCGQSLTATAEVFTVAGYRAGLSGANEVPPVATGASGIGWFFLHPVTNELFYYVEVSGIAGITAAHIHTGAAGANGPVLRTLWGGEPPAFGPGDPIRGRVLFGAADIAVLNADGLYVNVHTAANPGGEIRGQLLRRPGTPTPDPDLSNNTDIETTTVECPGIEVVKTITYDGTCPGRPFRTYIPGRPVTFCYAITNTGTTFLDNIMMTDTLKTKVDLPTIIFTDTIRAGADPKLPIRPGETVLRQTTIMPFIDTCGPVQDMIMVTANPTNSGRTDLPCLNDVEAMDIADIYIACGGNDYRLQLPVLNTEECETWLQVQNLGEKVIQGMIVIWGEAGACPPQAAGPLKIECTGLLSPGSAWSFSSAMLPPGSRSAIAYSLNASEDLLTPQGIELPFSRYACGALFDLLVGDDDQWFAFDKIYSEQRTYIGPAPISGPPVVLDFQRYKGEPMAISVNRKCPDPVDPARSNNAAYIGVSTDMEGTRDPVVGGYTQFAPLLFGDKGGLTSTIYIHNSGWFCSSLELWFYTQDNCLRPILGDVLSVAPGETAVFDPSSVVGPDWLGSAWIRASQPLGVVVDTMGPNHFTSYRGSPADVIDEEYAKTISYGSQVNFAPLTYSEYQGWDTAIQVQNLSAIMAAKVKVYFLDRSGGVITTLVDWICPRGSQSYFLPVIEALPGNWVGSVRVESQEWITSGGPLVDPPRIQSVVLLEQWADPARSERREAVAYNALTEVLSFDWQIGHGPGGMASGSAVVAIPLLMKGYNGVTSEIAITNVVPKPGFTDFAVYIYDQNSLIYIICEKLNERQVEYIDLATWGFVPPRFNGSAVISATFWEHHVFDGRGTHVRNLVGLTAVAVERVGRDSTGPDIPGDESKAFEGIPIFTFFPQRVVGCPGIPGPMVK